MRIFHRDRVSCFTTQLTWKESSSYKLFLGSFWFEVKYKILILMGPWFQGYVWKDDQVSIQVFFFGNIWIFYFIFFFLKNEIDLNNELGNFRNKSEWIFKVCVYRIYTFLFFIFYFYFFIFILLKKYTF